MKFCDLGNIGLVVTAILRARAQSSSMSDTRPILPGPGKQDK
jgi:hypothetical protein